MGLDHTFQIKFQINEPAWPKIRQTSKNPPFHLKINIQCPSFHVFFTFLRWHTLSYRDRGPRSKTEKRGGEGGGGINPNLCKVWAFSPKEMWNLEVPRRLEMHSKIINLWWLWKSENVFHIHTDQIKIPCDCLARKIRNSDWCTHFWSQNVLNVEWSRYVN